MSKEKSNSQSTKKRASKTSQSESKKDEKVTKTKAKTKDTKNTNKSNKTTKVAKEKVAKKKEVKEEVIVEDLDEELYDDDFGDIDEEVEIEKIVKKADTSKDNIKKIENMAKKKKVSNNEDSKLQKLGMFIETNRAIITSFIVGVLITILVVIIIWPDRIAQLKDGTEPVVQVGDITYTADDLYESMKESYSISSLLDMIDDDLLTDLYPEDDDMNDEVESNAEYYLTMYEQYYGYTQEEFLTNNGFSSYDDFLDYLRLDYRRTLYLDDYVEENLTDDEISDYYDENVYGDINVQHILIEYSDEDEDDDDTLTSDEAMALAEEIIDELNDGTSWDDIKDEYDDQITFEDLGYQSWDSDLEDSFKTALEEMDDDSYSTEPVETSYGYHVIYRLDQKDTPELDDVKDTIIENLVSDKESEDSDLIYKALISLRDENEITFSDTVMKSKYEAYKKQY